MGDDGSVRYVRLFVLNLLKGQGIYTRLLVSTILVPINSITTKDNLK